MLALPAAYLVCARAEDEDFAVSRLILESDYAAEAAMSAVLAAPDVGTDYTTQALVVSPERAPDAYTSVMCLGYGVPATAVSTADVLNSVSVMILAANDGYYIAEHSSVGGTHRSCGARCVRTFSTVRRPMAAAATHTRLIWP
jgi:hypothetical protein